MKHFYKSAEDYANDIYDKLYVRGKKAVDALNRKGVVTKFDLIAEGISEGQTARVVRDLKDHGIPIVTLSRIKVPQSKNPVVRYAYGDRRDIDVNWANGRVFAPSGMKQRLIRVYGTRCAFCGRELAPRELQVDHRLPIKYFGELTPREAKNPDNYLLVCAACNRKKAEAIERGCAKTCYKTDDMSVIKSCYWYDPQHYTHICTKQERRNVIVWEDKEANTYDILQSFAKEEKVSVQKLEKEVLEKFLQKNGAIK